MKKNTQWGVLILFGGGLALSVVLSQTQENLYLAQQLAEISGGLSLYFLLLLIIISMTEISARLLLLLLMPLCSPLQHLLTRLYF